MNARTLLNLGLAAVVAAIAAALYLRPQPAAVESRPLLPVAADILRRIEITRAQGPTIVLERNASGWRMSAPHAARLDEVALGRLLDLARLRTTSRIAAGELARFELDRPWATIRFDAHMVSFGTTNTLTQELYLASGGHVHAVPARYAAAVPSVPAKLLAHRLFAEDEQPMGIELKAFAMRHDGMRWQLTPEDPGVSQDDLVRWVDQWRMASSMSTLPAAGTAREQAVTVRLRDGRTIVLAIAQRTPDLVLVREDEALAYHLPARLAETLLRAPNAGTPAPPQGKP